MIARVHAERAHNAILMRLAVSAAFTGDERAHQTFSDQIRTLLGE